MDDKERITDLENEVATLDTLFKNIGTESRKRGARVKVLEDALGDILEERCHISNITIIAKRALKTEED